MTFVASATRLADGRPFVQVIAARAGMLWLPDWLAEQAKDSGFTEVALQSRGAPAMEFVSQLERNGLTVHGIDGSHVGSATGTLRDRVRDGLLVTVPQPDVEVAVQGGLTRRYAENDAWSRVESLPVDIAPLAAMTWALFGLETCEPEDKKSAYSDHGLMVF